MEEGSMSRSDEAIDEGHLDPWVADWLERELGGVEVDIASVVRAGRNPSFPAPPARELAATWEDVIDGVAVRVYRPLAVPTGILLYFHGGGFCSGSVAAMDAFARELAHQTGATVISVEYPLSPAHPYPAALDACETVTRQVLGDPSRFGAEVDRVVLSGESAGGNLATAVAIRLRDRGAPSVAGQVLIYPSVDGAGSGFPSEVTFGNLIIDRSTARQFWEWYRVAAISTPTLAQSPSQHRASPGSLRRSSSSVVAMRCATLDVDTRTGSARRAWMSPRLAIPASRMDS
jgi:acetyl esterase